MSEMHYRHEPGGTWKDEQWTSDAEAYNAPRRITVNSNPFQLAYITLEEMRLLKKLKGFYEIEAFSRLSIIDKSDGELSAGDEKVDAAPLFWISEPSHCMSMLCYISDETADFLSMLDLHGSGVDKEKHYGPQDIPSYNGGGGMTGRGGGSSSGSSGGRSSGGRGFGAGGVNASSTGNLGFGGGSLGGSARDGGGARTGGSNRAAKAAALSAAPAPASAPAAGWTTAEVGSYANPSTAMVANVPSDPATRKAMFGSTDTPSIQSLNFARNLENLNIDTTHPLVPSFDTFQSLTGLLPAAFGIPGALAKIGIDSLASDTKPSLSNVVGLATVGLTKNPLAGQFARLATMQALDGRAPGWGDWGGLATSALGFGSFPGQVMGRFAQAGELPGATTLGNYAVGQIAARMGINPSLAQAAFGGLVGLASREGGIGPTSAGGVNNIGWGSWGGGGRNLTGGNQTPTTQPMGFTAGEMGFGTGTAPIVSGGLSLAEGGQGLGNIIPGQISLRPQSVPAARLPGRTIATEAAGDQSGSQQGPKGPGEVLARTIGGARRGF